MVVDRNGQRFDTTTVLGTDVNQGLLGVKVAHLPEPTKRLDPVHAVGQSFTEFGTASREALHELGRFFSPSGLSNFASQVVHGGKPTVDGTSGAPAPHQLAIR